MINQTTLKSETLNWLAVNASLVSMKASGMVVASLMVTVLLFDHHIETNFKCTIYNKLLQIYYLDSFLCWFTHCFIVCGDTISDVFHLLIRLSFLFFWTCNMFSVFPIEANSFSSVLSGSWWSNTFQVPTSYIFCSFAILSHFLFFFILYVLNIIINKSKHLLNVHPAVMILC